VFYYAPWCKQCEQMAPTWDALAEFVKGEDDIVIAKFNSIENELNEFAVTKQPTIRFHTRDNKDGIDFTGDARNMTELQTFMAEHSAAFRAHYDRVHTKPNDEL